VDPVEEEQRRLKEAEQAAFERGLERARKQAMEEAERAVAERLSRLDAALAELQTLRGRMIAELRDEISALVLTASARILRERLDEGDPVVARILGEVLEADREEIRWRIRLHPDDLQHVQENLPAGGQLELVADESLVRGGLVAESLGESIDARVEAALASLRRAFEGGR
jgi:flagellar assembly protein FliH